MHFHNFSCPNKTPLYISSKSIHTYNNSPGLMEGGSRVLGYEISQKNINSPPLSAIDRFLFGQKNKKIKESEFYSINPYSSYGSFQVNNVCDYENGTSDHASFGSFHSGSFMNGIESSLDWANNNNLKFVGKELEDKSRRSYGKGDDYSLHLIKGQWTEEEDRFFYVIYSCYFYHLYCTVVYIYVD